MGINVRIDATRFRGYVGIMAQSREVFIHKLVERAHALRTVWCLYSDAELIEQAIALLRSDEMISQRIADFVESYPTEKPHLYIVPDVSAFGKMEPVTHLDLAEAIRYRDCWYVVEV